MQGTVIVEAKAERSLDSRLWADCFLSLPLIINNMLLPPLRFVFFSSRGDGKESHVATCIRSNEAVRRIDVTCSLAKLEDLTQINVPSSVGLMNIDDHGESPHWASVYCHHPAARGRNSSSLRIYSAWTCT